MEDNKIYIDGIEYDLDNLTNLKATLQDILVVTLSNEQAEAESEADFGTFYRIQWRNNQIIISFCEDYESNESYNGNTEHTEHKINMHTICTIDASLIDFIDILKSYKFYKYEYIKIFGKKRLNNLYFYPISTEIDKELKKQCKNEEITKRFQNILQLMAH